MQLLISDLPHFLWVAVLHIESVLALEEHIASKLLGCLALILLLKVHEGLLSSWNDHNLGDVSLTCSREVDSELFISGTWRKVLDEEAEEHDRLLVFEVVHLELVDSLLLLLRLADVEIGQLTTLHLLDLRSIFLVTKSAWIISEHVLSRFLGRSWLCKANESEAL